MNWLKEMLQRAMLMDVDDGGAGTGVDTDSGGAGPVVDDAAGAAAEPPAGEPSPEGDGTGDADPVSFQLGERTISEQQMLDAIEAMDNKATWEGELHKKGEDLNVAMAAMERARTGQPMDPNAGHAAQNAPGHVDMDAEQLRDMLTDTPEKFMSLITEKVAEVTQAAIGEAMNTQASKTTAQEHFLGKNADFNEVVGSREFESYMAQLPKDTAGKPIYSTANGYLMMQLESANARVAAAESAGFKLGAEDAQKNNDAKNRIKILRGGGAGAPPPAKGNDLKGMSENDVNKMAYDGLMAKRAAAAGQ